MTVKPRARFLAIVGVSPRDQTSKIDPVLQPGLVDGQELERDEVSPPRDGDNDPGYDLEWFGGTHHEILDAGTREQEVAHDRIFARW